MKTRRSHHHAGNGFVGMRIVLAAALAAFFYVPTGAASASGLDSEHLFGLTEGTDIGAAGEREVELEFSGRGGKHNGAYRVLSFATALKLTLTDSFRVAPFFGFHHHHIRSVEDLDNRNRAQLGDAGVELKFRALDRTHAPFGLTFGATPYWSRLDETGGERVTAYGANVSMLVDKELIANTLLAAVNIGYAPRASRNLATGFWSHDSGFFASAALSGRIADGVFLGGEIRHGRAYEGIGLDRLDGHAWFAGPSIYARLGDNAWISAVWSAQIAGHAKNDPRSLDLTNFGRHLMKVRIGIAF
jgi:hypothetical protein